MPPSEQELEYEITLARNDLEANLAELQLVVREKLDVRRRAREAFERAKVVALAIATRNVAVTALASMAIGFWWSRRHAS
ncbi:MAG TPA: hypothetical protein VM261_06765 [Kofleriaceae bacterium]|nr:hypothetical protein [Kofleriaceae bacterium]